MSIEDLEANMPKGHWIHSNLLSAIDACKEWGIKPSEFGLCKPEDDLTYMCAYISTKRSIDTIDSHIKAEESKPKGVNGRRKRNRH